MDSETKGMMVTEVAVTDKEIKVTWTDANGDVKRVSSEDMPTKEFEEQLRVWNAEEASEIEELLYLAGRYAMGERFNAQPDLFGEIVEVEVEDKE